MNRGEKVTSLGRFRVQCLTFSVSVVMEELTSVDTVNSEIGSDIRESLALLEFRAAPPRSDLHTEYEF